MAENYVKVMSASDVKLIVKLISVQAFGNLAKESNTLLLPSNVGDVSGMVTQAMTIYKKLDNISEKSENPSEQ